MRRDFTYVDDVSEAIERLIDSVPSGNENLSGKNPDPGSGAAPWRTFNIGKNRAEDLMRVVRLLETEFGRRAHKKMLSIQPGDVPSTYADVDDLMKEIGFRPSTSIESGVCKFAAYRNYHGI